MGDSSFAALYRIVFNRFRRLLCGIALRKMLRIVKLKSPDLEPNKGEARQVGTRTAAGRDKIVAEAGRDAIHSSSFG